MREGEGGGDYGESRVELKICSVSDDTAPLLNYSINYPARGEIGDI